MQWIARVSEYSDLADSRNCFGQYFHAFACELGAVKRYSSDVTTRMSEARHKTRPQRVGRGGQYNGNSRRLTFSRKARRSSHNHDRIWLRQKRTCRSLLTTALPIEELDLVERPAWCVEK
jgi:hypothetical protein